MQGIVRYTKSTEDADLKSTENESLSSAMTSTTLNCETSTRASCQRGRSQGLSEHWGTAVNNQGQDRQRDTGDWQEEARLQNKTGNEFPAGADTVLLTVLRYCQWEFGSWPGRRREDSQFKFLLLEIGTRVKKGWTLSPVPPTEINL